MGAESRPKVIAAAALGVICLFLVAQFLFSGPSAPHVAAAPAVTPATRPGAKTATAAGYLDPTLRYDWLKSSEGTKYEGKGRNIFVAGAEPPPTPLANGTTDHHPVEVVQPTGPAPTPPPPPINLKFYGFASSQGEAKKIFLTEGEDIFVAKEGDIIDRRYKILHISPTSVEVEDVLNNNRQQLPLVQGG